jgi:hypothetical protein
MFELMQADYRPFLFRICCALIVLGVVYRDCVRPLSRAELHHGGCSLFAH